MSRIVSKGRHVLGKLSRNGDKRAPRNCEAALTWELRETDAGKLEFSACGEVWNHIKTDIIWGGQCVQDLAALFPRDVLAQRIASVHKAWHLNGMRAGTPEQEAALEDGRAALVKTLRDDPNAARLFYGNGEPNWHAIAPHLGMSSAYDVSVHILREAGLYEVPVTESLRVSALGGLPDDAKTYRYGTRHLHASMPADVVELVKRGFQDADAPGATGGESMSAPHVHPHAKSANCHCAACRPLDRPCDCEGCIALRKANA